MEGGGEGGTLYEISSLYKRTVGKITLVMAQGRKLGLYDSKSEISVFSYMYFS